MGKIMLICLRACCVFVWFLFMMVASIERFNRNASLGLVVSRLFRCWMLDCIAGDSLTIPNASTW